MSAQNVVVIGGSAGALEPLQTIVRSLPRNLPAAVLVVIHQSPSRGSRLPQILARGSLLVPAHARGGEPLEHGRLYLAPADQHLLVHDGHVRLSRGPRENHARPAIDPLFRSAAVALGPNVVAVLLSGILDDGASGTLAIKRAGGAVLVQDPGSAVFSDMPENAIATVEPDAILSADKIAPAIVELLANSDCRRAANGDASGGGQQPREVAAAIAEFDETAPDIAPRGRHAVRVLLPGLRRCLVGVRRQRDSALSLPRGARLRPREPARSERHQGGERLLGRPARAGGAGRRRASRGAAP